MEMKREGVRVEVRLRSRFPKLAIPPPLFKLAAIQVRKENGEKENLKEEETIRQRLRGFCGRGNGKNGI